MPNPPPAVVDAVADATVFFALVLAFALLIERLLEVTKSLYDWVDSRFNWYPVWSRRAESIAAELRRHMRMFEYVPPQMTRSAVNRVWELLLNKAEGGYAGNALVISGDLVRQAYVRLGCKILGMAVGVLLAFAFQIDLLAMWPARSWPHLRWATSVLWENGGNLRLVMSGLAIGLGAGPVHKLITTLERKQRESSDKADGE